MFGRMRQTVAFPSHSGNKNPLCLFLEIRKANDMVHWEGQQSLCILHETAAHVAKAAPFTSLFKKRKICFIIQTSVTGFLVEVSFFISKELHVTQQNELALNLSGMKKPAEGCEFRSWKCMWTYADSASAVAEGNIRKKLPKCLIFKSCTSCQNTFEVLTFGFFFFFHLRRFDTFKLWLWDFISLFHLWHVVHFYTLKSFVVLHHVGLLVTVYCILIFINPLINIYYFYSTSLYSPVSYRTNLF